MKILRENNHKASSLLVKLQKSNNLRILIFQKIILLLFVILLMMFTILLVFAYKFVFTESKQNHKIINDISVINDDKKHISEREFKQRFPSAFKAWRKNVKDLDDEYDRIDGALYIIKNNEIVIYFHNGFEPTFILKYDHVSDQWYETSPE